MFPIQPLNSEKKYGGSPRPILDKSDIIRFSLNPMSSLACRILSSTMVSGISLLSMGRYAIWFGSENLVCRKLPKFFSLEFQQVLSVYDKHKSVFVIFVMKLQRQTSNSATKSILELDSEL